MTHIILMARPGEPSFFHRLWQVDMSRVSLELVAKHVEWKRLEGFELRHPDLWHDGRWLEK